MDLDDALRSTGAVRAFTDDPVDDATIAAILADARFAPSGGNRQPWRVAVVKAPEVRRELADLVRPVWDDYVAASASGVTPFTAIAPAGYTLESTRSGSVANGLIDDIESVPAVLVVAADLARIAMMDLPLDRPTLSGGASIYPFCWSILLAAHDRGLGGVLTTFLCRVEPAAAPLLGLPDGYAIAATIYLGHPVRRATRLRRNPVASFCTIDRFDGEALTTNSE